MGFKLCTLFQFRVQIYNFFCKYANIFATIWKFGAFSFGNLDKSPIKVRQKPDVISVIKSVAKVPLALYHYIY